MSSVTCDEYKVKIIRNSDDGSVLEIEWTQNGQPSRVDGPAFQLFDQKTGNVILEHYKINGHFHRDEGEGPALAQYTKIGFPTYEYYFSDGVGSRKYGPSEIRYYQDTGNLEREIYKYKGAYFPSSDRGSVIHYDNETGIAVREDFFHGPEADGDYSTEGPARIIRNRLTGEISSVLVFDGKQLIEQPTPISTFDLFPS